MNDQAVEMEIKEKCLTAPRITLDDITALVDRITFSTNQPDGTTSTHVHAYLDGRFYLASGHSACVSLENFNAQLGFKIAQGKAIFAAKEKLWELEGYRLYQQLKETK